MKDMRKRKVCKRSEGFDGFSVNVINSFLELSGFGAEEPVA